MCTVQFRGLSGHNAQFSSPAIETYTSRVTNTENGRREAMGSTTVENSEDFSLPQTFYGIEWRVNSARFNPSSTSRIEMKFVDLKSEPPLENSTRPQHRTWGPSTTLTTGPAAQQPRARALQSQVRYLSTPKPRHFSLPRPPSFRHPSFQRAHESFDDAEDPIYASS